VSCTHNGVFCIARRRRASKLASVHNPKASSAATATSAHKIARRDPTESDLAIEILFCGICHSNLHSARNTWSEFISTVSPIVPGHEIVGRVTKVGSAVTTFKPGDLATVGCLIDSDSTCTECHRLGSGSSARTSHSRSRCRTSTLEASLTAPPNRLAISPVSLIMRNRNLSGAQTSVAVLKPRRYLLSAHSTTSPTMPKSIPLRKVNEAYERLFRSDVKVPLFHRHGFFRI